MDQVEQLRVALDKAEARVKRLMAQTDAARKDRDELETAIRVIERFASPGAVQTASGAQSDNGQLIYSYTGVGRANARAPKDIIEAMRAEGHDLGDDLVRTQLWRMAKRNELQKADGRYWRPVISSSNDDGSEDGAQPEEPAVKAQSAVNEAGSGWGQVAPPSPSQPHKPAPNWGDDLEDDTPFPPQAPPSRGFADDLDDDIPF